MLAITGQYCPLGCEINPNLGSSRGSLRSHRNPLPRKENGRIVDLYPVPGMTRHTRCITPILILLFVLVTHASAEENVKSATTNQKKDDSVTMAYFVFLYTRDTGWVEGRPALEQPFLDGHFEYMTCLQNEGTLVLGGPFNDESGVMGVLKAGSLEDAERLIHADPVIRNNVLKAQVKAWTPSVTGCIE